MSTIKAKAKAKAKAPAPTLLDTLSTAHREPGWESRFLDLVSLELSQPFDWVSSSCIDLMLASVLACRGPKHPAALAQPSYTTKEEALKELSARGGLQQLLDKYFVPVPALHAMQADLVLLKSPDDDSAVAGGVVLDGVIAGKREGSTRAYRLPLTLAYKVYRV